MATLPDRLEIIEKLIRMMKTRQDGLGGRFVSLDGAVQAVSSAMPITKKEEVDRWLSLNRPKNDEDDELSRQRAAIDALLRQGRASERLLDILNRPANLRPSWYEDSSGFARFNESVAPEGLEILHRWAKESWYSPPLPPSRWGFPVRNPLQASKPPRAMELGFDVAELRRALDAEGVPHGLDRLGITDNLGSTAAPAGAGKVRGEAATEKPKFRGPLAEVLSLAWENAHDKTSAHSVLAALCKLAAQQDPPIPLLRLAGTNTVEWADDTKKSGVSLFTLKDMRSRLRPKRGTSSKPTGAQQPCQRR